MSYWDYLLHKVVQHSMKKTGNEFLRNMSDIYDKVYTELKGIKSLNQGEDEYIRQLVKMKHPMERDVSTWDDDDARKIINSYDYQYNLKQQNKVNHYLNYRRTKNNY